MKINWKVRMKNKAFWVTAVPSALLLLSQVLQLFGVNWDYVGLSNQLLGIVGTVFGLLALLGVVADPTTAGVSDSTRAMGYDAPASDTKRK
ncbi:phage holin [Caproicibacterium sp. XB1]|uniref:phage holin n=1 Tax=Caproicibacterium sp. XB1 TaxID=3396405 RepID=UPI0039B6FB3A